MVWRENVLFKEVFWVINQGNTVSLLNNHIITYLSQWLNQGGTWRKTDGGALSIRTSSVTGIPYSLYGKQRPSQ